MKKAKFSNKDALSMPFAVGLSDDDMEEIREIVQADMDRIKADFVEQIHRLENIIKSKIGAIPRTEDFAEWFFKRKKIYHTGSKMPRITDEQIISYAKEYVDRLNAMIKSESKPSSTSSDFETFKWIGTAKKLNVLRSALVHKFVSDKTLISSFEKVFSGKPVADVSGTIDWQCESRNGSVNKRSVYDLIKILTDEGLIEAPNKQSELIRALNMSFSHRGKRMKFSTSNLKNSEEYYVLAQLIKKIK